MSKDLQGKYKLVLGLEIHLHLQTDRKMFCRCSADIYEEKPNTHTCPTCLGLPGALPVPNPEAVRKTQLLGLALNSRLQNESRFDRKHYFYPDLPKGYQISQYKHPMCLGGFLKLENGVKAKIERVHLEEDTAKSLHEGDKTLVDFNMSSMPLVEIVTEPIFNDLSEAVEFAKKVQLIVREHIFGTADMEKGQMRLEPNISLRTEEMAAKNELPAYKVEIKNINSFKFMEKAVMAEIKRQRELLDQGITPIQENRGYVEEEKATVGQRDKEHAHDYRYFPEPDIPPMVFSESYLKSIQEEYERIREETPTAKKTSVLENLNLEEDLKRRLMNELSYTNTSTILALVEEGYKAKKIANLFLNRPEYREMTLEEVVKKLKQEKGKISDESELKKVVQKILEENKDAVVSYKSGKDSALQFLIGMVMKETRGKADAGIVKEMLLNQLK